MSGVSPPFPLVARICPLSPSRLLQPLWVRSASQILREISCSFLLPRVFAVSFGLPLCLLSRFCFLFRSWWLLCLFVRFSGFAFVLGPMGTGFIPPWFWWLLSFVKSFYLVCVCLWRGLSCPGLFFVFMVGSLTVVQWNARSIRNKKHWLSLPPFRQADVFVVQESHLQPPVPFCLSRMNCYRLDRDSGIGGGLLTAVSSRFPSYRENLLLPPGDVEILCVKIVLPDSSHLQVVNIYSPRGIFNQNLLQALLQQCKSPYIILGDFNVWHSFWGGPRDTVYGNIIADWITQNPICILNQDCPTHVYRGGKSLIDLSLVSPDIFPFVHWSVHPDTFESDHFPIVLNIPVRNKRPVVGQVRPRYDWGRVADSLECTFGDSCSSSVGNFYQTVGAALTANKKAQVVNIRPGAPWWDSGCSFLLGQKRKYLKQAKRDLSVSSWIKYKRLTAKLRKRIKEVSREYWGATCQKAARSGSIYGILKRLQVNSQVFSNPYPILLVPSPRLGDSDVEADALASSFERVGHGDALPLDFSGNVDCLLRRPFEANELDRVVASRRAGTPGFDNIPGRVLTCLGQNGRNYLLAALNRVWSEGNTPEVWRKSLVVPVLKPGKDACNIESYRPISLTSVLAKVLEKMLLGRLTTWSLNSGFFHPNHHGFLPFRDCMASLTKIFNDIQEARKKKEFVFLVALDIKAAYDSIWLDGLALKLLKGGIDGKVTAWIYDFITDRKFQVRWKNKLSNDRSLNIGVPQGGVLSPFLFSVYMADIFECIPHGTNCVVYADDIFVYASDSSCTAALKRLQTSIDNIMQWGRYWKLSFSPEKCKAINFSNKRSQPENHLRISGFPIEWEDHIRILGLHFSANLTWSYHINLVRKKAVKKLNIFKYIASATRGINTRDLLTIAKVTIINTLSYGAPIFSFTGMTSRKKLEPILNAALRTAMGLPKWTPIPILRKEAKSLSLADLHNLDRDRFILKHLSLGEWSPIEGVFDYVKGPPTSFKGAAADLLDTLGVSGDHIIKFSPILENRRDNLHFVTDKYPFQSKNINTAVIATWFEVCHGNWDGWHEVATDASKSDDRASIAFWDSCKKSGDSFAVNPINSIFTAEALGILAALDLVPSDGKVVIFSDSLSVINALKNVNRKSPRVVIKLYNKLVTKAMVVDEIDIVWVPGHSGIPGNEYADLLARRHNDTSKVVSWISPEDLARKLKVLAIDDDRDKWLRCKYAMNCAHLTRRSWEHRKLRLPRRGEVLLARLRTRTLPTNSLLYRFRLSSSPLCPSCGVVDTCEHFLLECRRFRSERRSLFARLGISPLEASFESVCDLAFGGISKSRLIASFLLGSNRF